MVQHDRGHRTRRYWFVDGIPELASGLFLVVVGCLFLTFAVGPAALGSWLLVAISLVCVALLPGGRAVFHRIKARITYPAPE